MENKSIIYSTFSIESISFSKLLSQVKCCNVTNLTGFIV